MSHTAKEHNRKKLDEQIEYFLVQDGSTGTSSMRITGGPSRWDMSQALFKTGRSEHVVFEINDSLKMPVYLRSVSRRVFSTDSNLFEIEVTEESLEGCVVLEGSYSVQTRTGFLHPKK